jgi:sugar phosphate isomerase/epimerase
MKRLSRREILREFARGAAGAAAFSLVPRLAPAQEGDAAYGGFRMGIQTYSLRNFDLDRALDITKDLGLRFAQAYPGKHLPLTADASQIAALKEKFRSRGITLLSWGVVGFSKDHEKNKASFEFAKAMGFPVLVANPAPDSFDSLDRLTRETGIRIAIHNHGPQDKVYGRLEQVQKAVDKYPEAIGACVDTGHVLRSGEDPVKWIGALGPRVHDCHFKDFSDEKTEHIIGRGKLDVGGVLKALKGVKFGGILALEYELKEKDPSLVEDLRTALATAREAAKKL